MTIDTVAAGRHPAEYTGTALDMAPVAPPRTVEQERLYRKQQLAALFRIFAQYSYDRGVAGHASVRDPASHEHFWVNPMNMHFGLIKVSDLVLVDTDGNIVEGRRPINRAGFAIHSSIHRARPDAVAAAHTHSVFGKAWAATGRLLPPISQDACVFYEDHAIYGPYEGVVFNPDEGRRICETMGHRKGLILQNHGLLTVGRTVGEAAWWHYSMTDAARVQLALDAAGGDQLLIDHDVAIATRDQIATTGAAQANFDIMYEWIVAKEPDLLD